METIWHRWDDLIGDPEVDPLEVLRAAGVLRRYLSAVEHAAVRAARARGSSWQEVADAGGRTRQAAWEKWKDLRDVTRGSADGFRDAVRQTEREVVASWPGAHRTQPDGQAPQEPGS